MGACGRPAPAACPTTRRRRCTARKSCARASCGNSAAGLARVDRLEGLDELARGPRRRGRRPARRRARSSAFASASSKRCPSIPSTTSPNIWIRRRYESCAKRAFPVRSASPATASSFRPEVEDRVHHPRHRDRRAGADRDEQRIVRVAEALARSSAPEPARCSSISSSSPSGSSRRLACRRGRRRS